MSVLRLSVLWWQRRARIAQKPIHGAVNVDELDAELVAKGPSLRVEWLANRRSLCERPTVALRAMVGNLRMKVGAEAGI